MSNITDEESGLISQLREKLKDILIEDEQRSDRFLIRWIRARGHDLVKAEQMVRDSLAWRETKGVETVLKREFIPGLQECCPYYMSGRDKDGRLILELPFGKWDVKKIIGIVGEDEFFQYTTQMFERMMEKMREYYKETAEAKGPQNVSRTQMIVLSDFSGYSYRQLTSLKALQSCLQIATTYEAHYPEILGKAIIVNAPAIFPAFWSILKKLIDQKTADKIQFFGSKKEDWLPIITDITEPSQIGDNLGGTINRNQNKAE